jgi:hypothetical protein
MELEILKTKRKLSKFLCREMLLDYALMELDEERRVAVDEYLKKDSDLQEDLEKIVMTLKYSKEIGRCQLTKEYKKTIEESKTFTGQILEVVSWKNIPDQVKWTIQAVTIATAVAVFSILMPWKKIMKLVPRDPGINIEKTNDSTNMAEITNKDLSNEFTQNIPPKKPGDESSTDRGQAVLGGENSKNTQVEEVKDSSGSEKSKESIKEKSLSDKEVATNAEVSSAAGESDPVIVSGETRTSNVNVESETDVDAKKKPIVVGSKVAFKGEIYRAFMKIDKIDQVTPEIREKILSLGGEKAGEVQIGWRKVDGSYFHFSIEESQLESLKQYLGAYGPVRVYKDAHWKVMPEGKIRMILWVEDSEFKK